MSYAKKRSRKSTVSGTVNSMRTKRVARTSGTSGRALGYAKADPYSNMRTAGYLGSGSEYKFIDQYVLNSPISNQQTMTQGMVDPIDGCISAAKGGSGPNDRNGRKYTLTSAFVTGSILEPGRAGDGAIVSPICFVALVLDQMTNGAQCRSNDIYLNPAGDLVDDDANILTGTPLRNLENTSRFRVLATKQIIFPAHTLVSTSSPGNVGGYRMPFTLQWKGQIPVHMKDDESTVASVVDNSLHLVAFTNDEAVDGPLISYCSRVRFRG